MNNNGFISVIDYWLSTKLQINNGKYLCYKLSSEQTFLNFFDFLFALFKEINLKYIIINSNDLPKEEVEYLPFPSLIVNYDVVNENQVLGKVEMIENVDVFKSRENCFIVLAEDSNSNSISILDVFLGIVNNRSKEIVGGLFLVLLALGSYFDFFQLHDLIIFGLSLFGLLISQELLDEKNDVQNRSSLVNKVCGGGTSNSDSNCKKLSEQSSKVFGYFDWSELGVFYFLGILLNSLLIGISGYSTLFLYLILFTSSVGVLFSIYSVYQQFKLRVFCRACSLIILVFYFLFATSFYFSNNLTLGSTFEYELSLIFPVICFCSIFLLSMTYVFLIKKWNLIKQKYSYSKKRLMNYTTDSVLFNRMNTKKMSDDDLVILNEHSYEVYSPGNNSNTLSVFVCSHCPFCNLTLKEIYKDYIGSNLEVRIVHIPAPIGYESEEDAIKNASRVIAVLEKYGIEGYMDLIHFNQKVKSDAKLVEQEINTNYPIETSLVNDSLITASNILQIAKSYNISRYPTLMLNNTFVSSLYSLEELSLHF